jgi:hypothetical protein
MSSRPRPASARSVETVNLARGKSLHASASVIGSSSSSRSSSRWSATSVARSCVVISATTYTCTLRGSLASHNFWRGTVFSGCCRASCSLILVLSVAVAYAAYIGYRLFFRKGLKS